MLSKLLLSLGLCSTLFSSNFKEINSMTLEEKVGQLLIVHYVEDDLTSSFEEFMTKVPISGVIYYEITRPISDSYRIQSLSIALQKAAQKNNYPSPLFISVDHEGGRVSPLKKILTNLPSALSVAKTCDKQLAKSLARLSAKELKAIGVNLNFAPVVDINSNPKNPVIGNRSFGQDPNIVTHFARAVVNGYKEEGIISALKHFPGHGDVEIDSHIDTPVVDKPLDVLEKTELVPYKALAKDVDMIMTSHIIFPQLDAKNVATQSKIILTQLLRNSLGFEGVIVSDSLVMKGVSQKIDDVPRSCVLSLKAGCDLLIIGGSRIIDENNNNSLAIKVAKASHEAIIQAVKSGQITEAHLNASVSRVLNLKKKYNLYERAHPKKGMIDAIINCKEHKDLVLKVPYAENELEVKIIQ